MMRLTCHLGESESGSPPQVGGKQPNVKRERENREGENLPTGPCFSILFIN